MDELNFFGRFRRGNCKCENVGYQLLALALLQFPSTRYPVNSLLICVYVLIKSTIPFTRREASL